MKPELSTELLSFVHEVSCSDGYCEALIGQIFTNSFSDGHKDDFMRGQPDFLRVGKGFRSPDGLRLYQVLCLSTLVSGMITS